MPRESVVALKRATANLKKESNSLERKAKQRKSKPNEKKIYCPRCRRFIEVTHFDIICRICDRCGTMFTVYLNKST